VDKENIRFFFKGSDFEPEVVEGDVERVIYTGEHIQIVEYKFPPNKVFSVHRHDANEQMGYLVSGRMGFMVGGVEKILNPGDYYHAPVGIEHNAWTFEEPSVLLDIFGPPRDDLVR